MYLQVETLIIFVFFIPNFILTLESCNELVCGSIISKCLLTQSCQCDLTDCYCCKDCLYCLGNLFTECCNCLEICPEQNFTLNNQFSIPKSQVSDFDGIPELFQTLTSDLDNEKWLTFNIPINLNLLNNPDISNMNNNNDNNQFNIIHNCTVIFLNKCLTNHKCYEYCESMGANSYRWFYNGCCQCIGSSCINYGINENRCSLCPLDGSDDDDDRFDEEEDVADDVYDNTYEYDNEDLWDYGEND